MIHLLMISPNQQYAHQTMAQFPKSHFSMNLVCHPEQIYQLAPARLDEYDAVLMVEDPSNPEHLKVAQFLKETSAGIVCFYLMHAPTPYDISEYVRSQVYDEVWEQKDLLKPEMQTKLVKRAKRLIPKINPPASTSTPLIGKSNAHQQLLHSIKLVSGLDCTVLLQGETGVGKGVVAKCIHEQSERAQAPFIPINCSAIPKELLESELFGYTKGAFTGANTDQKGLFVQGDGGTLFLDEIGDMPLELQAKLLDVIQERRIRPVGGKNWQTIDIRLITATHQNLEELVAQQLFREDLFYRLNVFPILIPPLKERPEDIEPLAQHFIQKHHPHSSTSLPLKEDVLRYLSQQPLHGNVRELENLVQRALVWAGTSPLSLHHFQQQAISPTTSDPFSLTTSTLSPSPELLHEIPPAVSQSNQLWELFQENHFCVWQIPELSQVQQKLRNIYENAVYETKGRSGKLITQEPATLSFSINYLNIQEACWSSKWLSFHFLDQEGHDHFSGDLSVITDNSIDQYVAKGLPDTYLFPLLYPLEVADHHDLLKVSSHALIRALVLRHALENLPQLSLKAVFSECFDVLTSAAAKERVKGLQKDGLEALRAFLCRKGFIFWKASQQLKSLSPSLQKEVDHVFALEP